MNISSLPLPEQRSLQKKNFSSLLKQNRKRDHFSSFIQTKASRLRSRQTSNNLLKAYQGDTVLAWRSSLAPSEIFYALGIVPFFIESVSSIISMAKAYSAPLESSAAEHDSKDCCTFMRTIMGCINLNVLPTPDMLVGINFYCDVEPKVADVLSNYFKKPHFLLEIPFIEDEKERVAYLSNQIKQAMQKMAIMTGKKIDLDRLAEVIEFSNSARSYLIEVNKLRQAVPAPIRGREMLDYAAIIANFWGTSELVEIYKILIEELKERVDSGLSTVNGSERYRILWRHMRPYYDDTVLNYLELGKKAVIAFEEVNFVFWDEMDPRDPFNSLARKILANPSIGLMNRWITATSKVVSDYKIDGIIAVNQWGCRFLDSLSQYTKEMMKKEGTPVLVLDMDLIDKHNNSDSQIKTCIDSFIEIMGENKYGELTRGSHANSRN